MPPESLALAPEITAIARSGSIIALVAMLIDEACRAGASDIHLDPHAAGIRVRLRVDGILRDQHALPLSTHQETIARIKILAGLRTDEHQAAQDGRFRHHLDESGGFADIRVSVMPTYYGENAVLRILPDAGRDLALESLGFDEDDRTRMQEALEKTDGMILVTGPTGSGKTTTLYALLRQLHGPERSLITIEDPIEYAIPGVRQVQTNARTGLTFARGLRALLRQDPDAIMVGEIRDAETANLAVNTALTGHLLLSTLHTNDAATAIPRLFDLGVEPYLAASTLRFLLAQRLVRKICDKCREPLDLGEVPALVRGLLPADSEPRWSRGTGCDACGGSGYRGRACVSESLLVNDAIRDAMLRRAPADEIATLARESGMRSMLENGARMAARGATTIEEVLRVVHA